MQKEIEVMRVIRTPPMGKLVVQSKEHRLQNIAEVTDPNLRQLLLAAIGELIVFAGGYQQLVDAGVAPQIMPDSTTQSKQSPTAESLDEKQANFLKNLEAERDTLLDTPSTTKPPSIFSGRPAKKTPPTSKPSDTGLNIAAQIDEILQKQLATNPDLAGRSIHLSKDPQGGLRIEIDGQFYQRPKDIQDIKIQKAIKRALREWEKS